MAFNREVFIEIIYHKTEIVCLSCVKSLLTNLITHIIAMLLP